MQGNSCLGVGVRTAFPGELRRFVAIFAVLFLALWLMPAAFGQTTRLIRGGDPTGTFAFFDPPCTSPPCPGSSPITTITVGDSVQWDADPALSLGFHSTTEGNCGTPGVPVGPGFDPPFDCPPPTGDALHSTDHSGPGLDTRGDDGGTSTQHRNIDSANDSQAWHFPLPVFPGITNRIQFIKTGTFAYHCFPHRDVMRGTIIVNKANTVTATSSGSPSTSTVGQSVSFTVTVTASLSLSAATAIGRPTGTVSITDNGTTVGSASLVAAADPRQATATVNVTSFTVGTHTLVRAVYNNDVNYNTSTSGTVTQTVNKANPTVSITSNANPSLPGQLVTFTATVSGAGPTPTGSVIFKDGGTAISGSVGLSGGLAAFSTSTLTLGNHTITADYSGDTSYNTASGNLTNNPQVVALLIPTVTVTSSNNPQLLRQNVTFTATVSGTGATPTGSVTFRDGATSIATLALNGSGQATFPTSVLAGGNHTISVLYSGNATYASVTGNMTGNPQQISDFTVSATPTTLNGTPGQVRTYNGTVTSLGSYSRAVSLSCRAGGTAPPSTCTPSAASVTPAANGTSNFTVTVSDPGPAGASFNFVIAGEDTAVPFNVVPLTRTQAVTFNVVLSEVDLTAAISHANSDPVLVGQMVQFDASIKNVTLSCAPAATCPGHNLSVSISFSSPVSGIVATPLANCSQGPAPITCTFTTLTQGATQNITLQLIAPFMRQLSATATVTSNDSEKTPADNVTLPNTTHIRLRPFSRRGLPLILP